MAHGPEQLDLIPLTADEKHAAGLLVARLTLELEDVLETNDQERADMKNQERELRARILRVSHAIRDGRRPGLEDL